PSSSQPEKPPAPMTGRALTSTPTVFAHPPGPLCGVRTAMTTRPRTVAPSSGDAMMEGVELHWTVVGAGSASRVGLGEGLFRAVGVLGALLPQAITGSWVATTKATPNVSLRGMLRLTSPGSTTHAGTRPAGPIAP